MSHIEDVLAEAVMAAAEHYGWSVAGRGGVVMFTRRDGVRIEMSREVRILSYRVDILLVVRPVTGNAVRLAVECDGHDFHDRTKQQAAYDRARDRELLMHSVSTIRFTGSEIVHSPERCAGDVWDVVGKLEANSQGRRATSGGRGSVDNGEDRRISEMLAIQLEIMAVIVDNPWTAAMDGTVRAFWLLTNADLRDLFQSIRNGLMTRQQATERVPRWAAKHLRSGRYVSATDPLATIQEMTHRLMSLIGGSETSEKTDPGAHGQPIERLAHERIRRHVAERGDTEV